MLQLNLAVAYSKNGNMDEALKTVSAIVKEHPIMPRHNSTLESSIPSKKRFGEAAQAFQEALRLDPSDDVARLTYVKTLWSLGSSRQPRPSFGIICSRRPHDFDALYFTGVVEKGAGQLCGCREGPASSCGHRSQSLRCALSTWASCSPISAGPPKHGLSLKRHLN